MSDVASTGVCQHVARITYRPRTSGDGHSDIGHGDDEDPYEESGLIFFFLARLAVNRLRCCRDVVPANFSPATQRNTTSGFAARKLMAQHRRSHYGLRLK